ncbi:MAG: polyprenyl synthetase family protein [Desulfobacteraceae bacterium]|nr:polyprenyl synthetase family protein [Desulfobacteraceae bacterium]
MDPFRLILSNNLEHFEGINTELERALSSRVGLIEDIGSHSLLGHGKRLRPLLFVLSCQLCGYEGEDSYLLSTIFELIHTASLLHDDVLDNADVRRKKPSANHLWGNQAAVLEGDFLCLKSSSIALGTNNLTFLKRVIEATTQMTEGQIMELTYTHNWNTSPDEYMEIITYKTAVLLSVACACGAILSGAGPEVEDSLSRFGLNLGIAFQLIDDLLDYTSSQEEFGKPVGKDLREGKITLPLIYTVKGLQRSERERLENLFRNGHAGQEDYDDLIALVISKGGIEKIRNRAKSYVDKAALSLNFFPDSAPKKNLLELNQYIIERTY